MRISAFIGTFILMGMISAAATAEKKPASLPKIGKVALVALARDASRAAEVEAAVKEHFVKNGVAADTLRVLFRDKTPSALEITGYLQAQGYDTLLCMGPRKTIQITPADKTGKFRSVESCITSYLTGKAPTGEPLEADPIAMEAPANTPDVAAGSLRTPIPSAGAAPMAIMKGTLRFFNMTSEELIWEGTVQVKTPAEVQTTIQTKVIAYEINSAIQKSGLLPNAKK